MKFTFVELPIFTKRLVTLVDDETYREFQKELAQDPNRHPFPTGLGGLQKARLAFPGQGKSGSIRVLYLHLPDLHLIVFFYLWTKGEADNIAPAAKKELRKQVSAIKEALHARARIQFRRK